MSQSPAPLLGLGYASLPFPFTAKIDHYNIGHLGSDNLPGSPVAKPFTEDYLPFVLVVQPGFTSYDRGYFWA